jgi:hypothetical protein
MIARPKIYGGWGLKNMDMFGRALAAKSLWRCLTKDGLWNKVVKDKYIHNFLFKHGSEVLSEIF